MKTNLHLLLMVYLTPLLIFGQAEEQLLPTDLKHSTVITEPLTLYKGFFRSGIAASYGLVDKYFTEEGNKESFSNNIWAKTWFVQASIQYGISNRLQVQVDLPYKVDQISQSISYQFPLNGTDSISSWYVNGHGISDVTASVGYQILTETVSRPALGLFTYFTIPAGEKNPTEIVNENNYRLPSGSGEASLDLDLHLRKVIYPYSYSFIVSYKYFFGGSKIFDVGEAEKEFKTGSTINFEGDFNFHVNDWIAIQNALDLYLYGKDEVEGELEENSKWLVQYLPKLNFQLKRLRLVQAVSVPLKGKNTGADVGYILVAQYMF